MESTPLGPDAVTEGVIQVKDDLTAGVAEYLGVGPSMADRKEYLVFLAASILVSLGILLLLGYIYLWPLAGTSEDFIFDGGGCAWSSPCHCSLPVITDRRLLTTGY
jgi:hypothetical protein